MLILRRTRGTQPRGLQRAGCMGVPDRLTVVEAGQHQINALASRCLVCAATLAHRARRSSTTERSPNQPTPRPPFHCGETPEVHFFSTLITVSRGFWHESSIVRVRHRVEIIDRPKSPQKTSAVQATRSPGLQTLPVSHVSRFLRHRRPSDTPTKGGSDRGRSRPNITPGAA